MRFGGRKERDYGSESAEPIDAGRRRVNGALSVEKREWKPSFRRWTFTGGSVHGGRAGEVIASKQSDWHQPSLGPAILWLRRNALLWLRVPWKRAEKRDSFPANFHGIISGKTHAIKVRTCETVPGRKRCVLLAKITCTRSKNTTYYSQVLGYYSLKAFGSCVVLCPRARSLVFASSSLLCYY